MGICVSLKFIINELNPIILEGNIEIEELANTIIKEGAIPVKNEEDALHIAFSLYHEIDYLISWNFNHIVRSKTKRIVSSLALKEGYRDVRIISPMEGL